jgi:hypothetical protein
MDTDERFLRFVIVPKVANPWFEEVHRERSCKRSSCKSSWVPGFVDHLAPATASVTEQNSSAGWRDGSVGHAIDPVDAIATCRL